MKLIKKKARFKELSIETCQVSMLIPHPRNVRLHDDDNIQAIQASLTAFGQRKPIVVWIDNQVIAGCGTLEAAKALEWETIQIVRCEDLSESQALEYLIADNKTTDMSTFDFEALAHLMRDLKGQGASLKSTGFNKFELAPLVDGILLESNNESEGEKKASYTLKFSEEEWAKIMEKFFALAEIDQSLFEPKQVVMQACQSCTKSFVLHACDCLKPQRLKILKRARIT